MDAAWSPAALLPAALLALLGAALLAVLGRWYDRVPGRVAAVFALLLLLLLAPVLVGGKVLLPLGNLVGLVPYRALPPPRPPSHAIQADLVHQITPWQAQVRRALAEGRWPLWNELAGVGMPLMADPQSQAFQPLVAASLPLALPAAVGLTAGLRLLVALVGMFLLLRRQGLPEGAALCGSLAYGLSGGMLLWLGWPIANAVAWTPFALYAVVRCHRDGGRRDLALLAAVTAALLLGGHPETIVQAGLLMGVWALACAWERRRTGLRVTPFLLRAAGAVVLAVAAVAPLLLLQQAYLPHTDRAAALRFFLTMPRVDELWSAWQDPAVWGVWSERVESQLLSTVALRAFGGHARFWGAGNVVELGTASIGAAVGALALASTIGRRRTRFAQEGTMAAVAAVGLLLVAKPPLLNRFLAQLPLMSASAVHDNHRVLLLVALAGAYLAACEVARWCRGERHPRAAAIAGLATAAVLFWAYVGHPPPSGVAPAASQAPWLALQLAALLCTLGALRLRRRTAWVLAPAIALELIALHGGAARPAPARLFYPRIASLRFLERHLGDARLAGIADIFPANFAQMYGLNDLRIDGPARPRAFAELVDSLREPGPLTLANMAQLGQPGARLYDLLGVRYLLAPPGYSLPLPVAYRDATLWIYEHPRPLPRLFLPAAATVYRGGDWTAWFRRPRDFAARALVAAPPPGSTAPRWRARRAARATFSARRREPGRWAARLEAPEVRLLVASIYQDGGWRLLVDRHPHPTVLADGPLLGAWLPAGRHALELLYRPPGFVGGALLGALGLAAGLGWLMPLPRPGGTARSRP